MFELLMGAAIIWVAWLIAWLIASIIDLGGRNESAHRRRMFGKSERNKASSEPNTIRD